LDNVLRTLKIIPHDNIISIVGCGGDRDATKRAPMAKITQKLSDYSIFTSDNPRTENLQNIFDDMKQGLSLVENNYEFIDSRETAIKTAIQKAKAHDIILVAGKGHENYQIIGTEKKHFDDVEIAQKYLSNLAYD
jgi:UDP-N-acetylmuramoyl-L-alanyl-D-glutamate--2,6-diaminopimelate ligase